MTISGSALGRFSHPGKLEAAKYLCLPIPRSFPLGKQTDPFTMYDRSRLAVSSSTS